MDKVLILIEADLTQLVVAAVAASWIQRHSTGLACGHYSSRSLFVRTHPVAMAIAFCIAIVKFETKDPPMLLKDSPQMYLKCT